MTDRIDENPPLSIPEQAAEWLLRWHCGDLTIAERFEYLQWLKTSPVHIAETLRMCRLYSWLESTKLKLFITNEDSFSNIVPLPPREREAVAAREANGAGLWRARLAAGVAAIGLTALFALAAKVVWFDHTLQTHASEWRSVPLSDGSSISAMPFTKLHHDIDGKQRLITLSQGSATFRVAKDESRPFLVRAGGVVVMATGTQFGVRRLGGKVEVTVSEGSVAVNPAADSSLEFESRSLGVDDMLTISESGATQFVRVNAEEKLELARGRGVFKDGTEVRDAVREFNLCNRMQIVVDDTIADRQIRGVFELNDPQTFAIAVDRALSGSSRIRVSEDQLRIEPSERQR
jgi:transmembrane sensor